MISKSSVCCRMIATHVKKIKKLLVWLVMLVGGVSGLLTSCVDNDDVQFAGIVPYDPQHLVSPPMASTPSLPRTTKASSAI